MALLDTFSCPRRPRLTPTRALWARVGATGHAVVLSPLGSHIALKRAPKGAGGSGARAPGAPCAARSSCCPWCAVTGVRSSWAWATATGRAVVLSPLGVRIALVARTCLGRGGGQLCNDAARGSRSCRTRTGLTRRGIPPGVGDSLGPYERPAHSRLAPRAHTVRAWGLVGLVRPRVAHREERAGVQ